MRSLRLFLSDIKIAHSIFALPFAAAALRFAHVGLPSFTQALQLLIAMVSARSWAMGMNRYIDRGIDLKNPRTAGRMIPRGELPAHHGLGWSLVWALIFIGTAFSLNKQTGLFSIPLLLILACYSYTKRFTWFCHWYLGLCLGLAPLAVSVALGTGVQPAQLLIGAAVMMWTAGFDIIYSLQDQEFDRRECLYSIPVRYGFKGALWISRLCFVTMVILLSAAGVAESCSLIYFGGVTIIAAIMAYEHWLVREGGNIDQAFFTVNSWVGIIFFVFSVIG
jgi:4-hydroxybenzoate polyprenyltransferase